MISSDPFDPNTWVFEEYEHRIYLDNNAQLYAIVDEIDYQWAIQWCWNAKRDPGGAIYARRAVSIYDDNGARIGSATVYLHVEVMKRTRKRKPSAKHTQVDHRKAKTLDCRRSQIRWVTPSMNQKNRWANASYDLVED